jgi:hypothetical protein
LHDPSVDWPNQTRQDVDELFQEQFRWFSNGQEWLLDLGLILHGTFVRNSLWYRPHWGLSFIAKLGVIKRDDLSMEGGFKQQDFVGHGGASAPLRYAPQLR